MYSVYERKKENLICILNEDMIVDELSYKYILSLTNVTNNTIRISLYSICHLLNYLYIRRIKLDELVASSIPDFKIWLGHERKKKLTIKSKISDSSWNTYIAYIGNFIEWLDYKDETYKMKIDRNLLNKQSSEIKKKNNERAKQISWRSNVAKKTLDYLTMEERKLIRKELSKRDQLIYDVMITTGLRLGEMFSLTVDKFPLNRNGDEIVTVELSHTGDMDRERQLKTNSRTIYLHIDIYNNIIKYINSTRKFRINKNGYVFITRKNSRYSEKGGALSPSSFRNNFNDVIRKLGLKDKKFRPHIFRHTFATDVYLQTRDIKLVQDLLGHKSLNTSQLYAHQSDNDIVEYVGEVLQSLYRNILTK